jgi:UDP-N-acetylglucosamine--N-acetylmuramyl-(pentapeptide) pyrophosphoryl-undecaprenol N-acetylglucosamine transferase
LILLGTKNADYAAQFEAYSNVTSFTFIEHLEQIGALCQISDLSITRGSATSLAEQQLFGLRKIIIPLPHTGGNHQYYNAKWYEKEHGDCVLEQGDGLEEQLLSMLS